MGKKLGALWLLVRVDAKRLWLALRHPQCPTWLKVGTGLLVLYLVSPIDILPDAIPLLGVVDDLVLIPLAIHWMLKRLPAPLRAHIDNV